VSDPVVRREEVESALAARHELGRDYETEIVDTLVERIERRLDERHPLPAPGPPMRRRERDHDPVIRLALGSIGLAVGATAIATTHGDAWLAAIVWVAIAMINIAYALRR
jgi:hypothetical protein